MKRLFDLFASFFGILFLFPLFIIIALLIKMESKGPIIYKQKRVGKNFKIFNILKFRTMIVNTKIQSLITIGERDLRITKTGYFLRKYKIDELPQLINVIKGEMSLVGPRPEVKKYVDYYTEDQKSILSLRPGITDMASITFRNESEILATQINPEKYYIEVIMPEKIKINKQYQSETKSVLGSINIILKTLKVI